MTGRQPGCLQNLFFTVTTWYGFILTPFLIHLQTVCARLTPCLCCEVYSKNSYPTVLWGGSVIWSASVSLPVCPCWCNGPSSLLSSQCCFSASCAWQTAPPAWGGCCCLSKGLKHRNMLGEKYFHIQIFFSWINAHLNYFKAEVKESTSHFQWNVLSGVDGSEGSSSEEWQVLEMLTF